MAIVPFYADQLIDDTNLACDALIVYQGGNTHGYKKICELVEDLGCSYTQLTNPVVVDFLNNRLYNGVSGAWINNNRQLIPSPFNPEIYKDRLIAVNANDPVPGTLIEKMYGVKGIYYSININATASDKLVVEAYGPDNPFTRSNIQGSTCPNAYLVMRYDGTIYQTCETPAWLTLDTLLDDLESLVNGILDNAQDTAQRLADLEDQIATLETKIEDLRANLDMAPSRTWAFSYLSNGQSLGDVTKNAALGYPLTGNANITRSQQTGSSKMSDGSNSIEPKSGSESGSGSFIIRQPGLYLIVGTIGCGLTSHVHAFRGVINAGAATAEFALGAANGAGPNGLRPAPESDKEINTGTAWGMGQRCGKIRGGTATIAYLNSNDEISMGLNIDTRVGDNIVRASHQPAKIEILSDSSLGVVQLYRLPPPPNVA